SCRRSPAVGTPKQSNCRVTASIPALKERGFVGGQETAATVTPPSAARKGGVLEIALPSAWPQPDMPCTGGERIGSINGIFTSPPRPRPPQRPQQGVARCSTTLAGAGHASQD